MSDEKVIDWGGVTRLETPPTKILATAAGKNLSEVVVVGYDKDGDFYFASSKADGPSVLWALEKAKIKLLEVGS